MQVLHSTDDFQTDPILAAVGALQFEVVQARAARSGQVAWLGLWSRLENKSMSFARVHMKRLMPAALYFIYV